MRRQPGTGTSDDSPDWDTLARYLVDESSPEEVKAVEAWLADHPAEHARLGALRDRLSRLNVAPGGPVETESALASVLARRSDVVGSTTAFARPSLRRRGVRPLLAVAASLLAIAAGVRWLSSGAATPQAHILTQRVETTVGQLDSVRLADGSIAVLGPMSSITISPDFGNAERRIVLRGQAYFDVVHDEVRPFTVHAGRTVIRDVGTSFTVQETPNGVVSVAVASGVIELRDSSTSPATQLLILHANQSATAENGIASLTSGSVPTSNAFEWMRRRLRFSDAPLSEVVPELARWYGLEFRFADPGLLTRHLTASFDDEPASRVLNVIALALDADLVRNGDVVTARARR